MLSFNQAEKIIDSLDFHQVVKKVFDLCNYEATGHFAAAYLNLDTGKMEYHWMRNSDSFREGSRICIYSLDSEFTSNIPDDDIAGDDDIPDGGVRAFTDYDERLFNCVLYYAIEGKDEKQEAYLRLSDFYRY